MVVTTGISSTSYAVVLKECDGLVVYNLDTN